MTASHPEAMLLFPIQLEARGYLFYEYTSCDLISPGICLHCIPWGLLAKKQRSCCPLMPWHIAALTPNGEMPQCFSQEGLGRSEPGGEFLGDIDISGATAGFSATGIVDTGIAPKSWSETPCSGFTGMLNSGQCVLSISLTFPVRWGSAPTLTIPLTRGSQLSVCCAASAKMAASFYILGFLSQSLLWLFP